MFPDCQFRHYLTESEIFGLSTAGPIPQSSAQQLALTPSSPSSNTPKSSETCAYFPLGRCRNGDKCPYKHDASSPSPSPANQDAPRQLKPCLFFQTNSCKNGSSCPFAHISTSTSTSGAGSSRAPAVPGQCRYFAQGACAKGNSCSFRHHQLEMSSEPNKPIDDVADQPSWADDVPDSNAWGMAPTDVGGWGESAADETPWGGGDSATPEAPEKSYATKDRDYGFSSTSKPSQRNVNTPRICKWFQQGDCRRGSSCTFYHDLSEVHRYSDSGDPWTNTSANGEASQGWGDIQDDAPDEDAQARLDDWSKDWPGESNGTGGYDNTPPPRRCHAFDQGYCRRGESCRFYHDGNPGNEAQSNSGNETQNNQFDREYGSEDDEHQTVSANARQPLYSTTTMTFRLPRGLLSSITNPLTTM